MGSSPFGPMRLIVNPRSGRGSIARSLADVRAVLAAEDLDHDVARTEGPGHAIDLTREAVAGGIRYVVAVGGDGTVHEVVNGLMGPDGPAAEDLVLGVIPSGSGCDFVRTFGIKQEPERAASYLAGKTVWGKLDVGRVRYATRQEERTRWFVNVAEAGIGAHVVRAAATFPRFLAGRAYRLAALKGILTYRPQRAVLAMNGRKARGVKPDAPLGPLGVDAKATMVVVANCQFFGGGLRVAPRAIPSDGMFDVLVGEGGTMQALTALRKMPLGDHVPAATIAEYVADAVTLDGPSPLLIEADGELLGTTPATFDLVRGAISMKV
ncbi:MAG TPA: diacylglycerol kinase family protein [Actinomycetota bacterium]